MQQPAKKPERESAQRLADLLAANSTEKPDVDQWVEQLAQQLAERLVIEPPKQQSNQPADKPGRLTPKNK